MCFQKFQILLFIYGQCPLFLAMEPAQQPQDRNPSEN